MTEVPMIKKPVYWFAMQIKMDWLLNDKNLCHERVNMLMNSLNERFSMQLWIL